MDDIRVTTGSTYDNAEHLSADFLKKVREPKKIVSAELKRSPLPGLKEAIHLINDRPAGRHPADILP
jgi:hypothetical protein